MYNPSTLEKQSKEIIKSPELMLMINLWSFLITTQWEMRKRDHFCKILNMQVICLNDCRIIYFGGYGYAAQGAHRGTFEYDESSSLVVCKNKSYDKWCI